LGGTRTHGPTVVTLPEADYTVLPCPWQARRGIRCSSRRHTGVFGFPDLGPPTRSAGQRRVGSRDTRYDERPKPCVWDRSHGAENPGSPLSARYVGLCGQIRTGTRHILPCSWESEPDWGTHRL